MAQSGLDFFYIIKPETTQNIHTNPSIETATTKYAAANGSTLARVSTQQRRGSYSLSVTPTSNVDGGMNTGTFVGSTNGIAASFDFLGVANIPYYVQFLNGSSTKVGTPVTFTGDGTWHRYEIFITGQTTIYVTVRKNNNANTGAFFIDGFQIENKISYSTTYVDGDQEGCYWDALAHAATSQRYANYRAGGRKVNLSSYSAYVLDMSGVGAPPVETSIQPYGNIPGGLYQGTTVKDRTMTIGVTVSGGTAASATNSDDLQMWQINMESIFNLIKPDLVYPQQPFILGYQHGNNDIEIACVYSGGLDLQNEKLKSISDIAFQVVCPQPFWTETTQMRSTVSQSPTEFTGASFADTLYVRDTNGTYTDLTPTGSADVFDIQQIYIGPVDGKLYVVGGMTKINNVTVSGVAVYDFMTQTWSSLGTGVGPAFSYVYAIVQMDNGDIIIGGNFTSANAVTTKCIARWNGTTFTVVGQANAFNAAPAPIIWTLAIDPTTRDILVGGQFAATTAPGCTTNYLGRIGGTGASGAALSWTGGGNFSVKTVGAVYVTKIETYGKYTFVTGKWATLGNGGTDDQTNNGFGQYNNTTFLWENVGTGLQAGKEGDALAVDKNGNVYIFGDFTTISGQSISGLAMWNGYQYTSVTTTTYLATAAAFNICRMFFDASNQLVLMDLGHIFRLIGTRLVRDIFNIRADLTYPIIGYNPENDNFLLSVNVQVCGTIPAQTIITNNGSTDAYPIIKIAPTYDGAKNVTNILYIRNNTNGKVLWFNAIDYGTYDYHYYLLKREVVTIDCRPNGAGTYSNFRVNQFQLDPITQEVDFFLSPGVNYLEVLSSDATRGETLNIEIFWTERHWTFAGGHS